MLRFCLFLVCAVLFIVQHNQIDGAKFREYELDHIETYVDGELYILYIYSIIFVNDTAIDQPRCIAGDLECIVNVINHYIERSENGITLKCRRYQFVNNEKITSSLYTIFLSYFQA